MIVHVCGEMDIVIFWVSGSIILSLGNFYRDGHIFVLTLRVKGLGNALGLTASFPWRNSATASSWACILANSGVMAFSVFLTCRVVVSKAKDIFFLGDTVLSLPIKALYVFLFSNPSG